jgi:zinc transporter ZupT
MHLLPEALGAGVSPQLLCGVLLAGLVFFFLLDKAELWHHGHEHHHGDDAAGLAEQLEHGDPVRQSLDHHTDGPPHAQHRLHAHHGSPHHHRHGPPGTRTGGGWAVLTGDSVHCFGDGILIASALRIVADRVTDFASRARLAVLFALAITLYLDLGQPIFNHHGPGYWIYAFLADFLGLTACGLVIARFFLPNAVAVPPASAKQI